MTKNTINSKVANKGAKGRYASVNGLKMYYEIHGTGEPLVLLHGGLDTIGKNDMPQFGRVLSCPQDIPE